LIRAIVEVDIANGFKKVKIASNRSSEEANEYLMVLVKQALDLSKKKKNERNLGSRGKAIYISPVPELGIGVVFAPTLDTLLWFN
jgi:hypothetical protein